SAGKPHPRSYGTFPRVLGRYARDERVLSLAEAVHKMTGLPARRLGLRDRGEIRVGAKADLVVFDAKRVADQATFEDPHRYPVGEIALSGPPRALGRLTLPGGFGRELGAAIEQVWRLQQHTLRITVLNEITRLLVSGDSLEDVFRSFAAGLARIVAFDSLSVRLVDAERAEFEVIAVLAGSDSLVTPDDGRLPLEGTLLARVVAVAAPVRVDDVDSPGVPESSRRLLTEHGYRSALLVPLVSRGGVFGAVTLASRRLAAFDDADVEIATDLARPLASAIEQRRLLDERRRRAEEP